MSKVLPEQRHHNLRAYLLHTINEQTHSCVRVYISVTLLGLLWGKLPAPMQVHQNVPLYTFMR